MLTVPEAARRAGRNPETIRRWIREGKLPARKVGTQHVLEEADLAAYLGEGHEGAERAAWSREIAAPSLAGGAVLPPVAIDPWLTTIVGRIVRAVDPLRIILFGSRARGDARPDSDYDLLVILEEVSDRRGSKLAIRGSFQDLPTPADILVASIDEVDGRVPGRPMGATFWALQEGQTIYDRGRA
jgi:uncharacterized protein